MYVISHCKANFWDKVLNYWTQKICMKVNKGQEAFTSEELLYIEVEAKFGTLLKREKHFL